MGKKGDGDEGSVLGMCLCGLWLISLIAGSVNTSYHHMLTYDNEAEDWWIQAQCYVINRPFTQESEYGNEEDRRLTTTRSREERTYYKVQIYCRVIDKENGLNYTAYASPHASWSQNREEVDNPWTQKRFSSRDDAREYRKQFTRKTWENCWYNPDDPDDVTMQEGGEWVKSTVIWGIVMLCIAVGPFICACFVFAGAVCVESVHQYSIDHIETHGTAPDSTLQRVMEHTTSQAHLMKRSASRALGREQNTIAKLGRRLSNSSLSSPSGSGDEQEPPAKDPKDDVEKLFDKLNECKTAQGVELILEAIIKAVKAMEPGDVAATDLLQVPSLKTYQDTIKDKVGKDWDTYCKQTWQKLFLTVLNKHRGKPETDASSSNVVISGDIPEGYL